MIATLSGVVFVKQPNHVIIDVGGVGYEVLISGRTYDRLPDNGDEVFLYIHTSVREDAITLYGFAGAEEKELFLLLNTVSGVGPKLALSILSGISAQELGEALIRKNMSRLTALAGVGRKTAERMCVELKDKVAKYYLPGSEADQIPAGESMEEDSFRDALSALTNLGYTQAMAWQALRRVQKLHPQAAGGMKIEELIREALRALA
ncbi:MAG: Holliday junction branch migration protein RuvA [Desulfobulbaceae bacterium]|jgi:Holliday junction DNA helicase RuvA|nr:Holliday junction branch migration protein RuvA [Desulfobulbaceae bacterium]